MKNQKIHSFMQGQGVNWINWVRNLPAASHMGGVWERHIRSTCAILLSLLKTHGKSLDEESLLTLVTETGGILNSRPLATETIIGPTSDILLSPSNILTMKSKVIYAAIREFQQTRLILSLRDGVVFNTSQMSFGHAREMSFFNIYYHITNGKVEKGISLLVMLCYCAKMKLVKVSDQWPR